MAKTTSPPRSPKVVPIRVDGAPPRKRPSGMWRMLHGLARALVRRGSRGGADGRPNPFTPATPLPGVVGEGVERRVPKIAMDAAEAFRGALDAGPEGGAG